MSVIVNAPSRAFLGLPEYPSMKSLELSDRAAFESCTRHLPCSSDHVFSGRWMWNITTPERIARIGRNLVITFADYLTHEPRVTLVGDDDVTSAALALLDSDVDRLDCVPEFVASALDPDRLLACHDRDQDDYVLDAERLATLAGRDLSKRRRTAEQCAQQLGPRLVASAAPCPEALLQLFDRWADSRARTHDETADERAAVDRLVRAWKELDSGATALFDGDVVIGLIAFQILGDTALVHYMKGDMSYRGVVPLLVRTACSQLVELGVRELNFEQDLGIAGLRDSKLRWRPVRFVRKYQVRRADQPESRDGAA
jgi:hypothetical protein